MYPQIHIGLVKALRVDNAAVATRAAKGNIFKMSEEKAGILGNYHLHMKATT